MLHMHFRRLRCAPIPRAAVLAPSAVIRTEKHNQASFPPFGPHQISVLIEFARAMPSPQPKPLATAASQ